MWHEYLAYLIIAAAFIYTAYRIYRVITNPKEEGACATCTETCQLRGLKQVQKKEMRKNCTNKQENRTK